MTDSLKCGILLVNTGTPASPRVRDVRKYLKRFLSDARIVPVNKLVWFFILRLFVLPKRARVSAEKYASIWTEDGSPFFLDHERLTRALNQAFANENKNICVNFAMNYSEPSVEQGLRLLVDEGCTRVVILPLYPQSAFCTTSSVCDSLEKAQKRLRTNIECVICKNYYNNPAYIKALAASILHAGFDPESSDRLLFSFHSIPLADVEAGDTYELQTSATSLQIATELGLERKRWTIAYQCRFDNKREWLAPFTQDVLERWAHTTDGRVFLVCPNFSVDCLETLFDVRQVLAPNYLQARRAAQKPTDNTSFVYVPCLGKSRAHVKVLREVLAPYIEGRNENGQ